MARSLVACLESTQGSRMFTDSPENWPALETFNRRIKAILEQPAPIDESGALNPIMLEFAVDAREAWIDFHDTIESKLSVDGELYSVRDIASKAADNAARIAGLFHFFENGINTLIELKAFEGAAKIANRHLHEAQRCFSDLIQTAEQANTECLNQWLVNYCQLKNTNVIRRQHIQQHGPSMLRKKPALERALNELIETNRVRIVMNGKQKEVHINPALLKLKPD